MLQSCTHWQNRNFQSNPIADNGTEIFLFLGLTERQGRHHQTPADKR
jgi:hypothetical protein